MKYIILSFLFISVSFSQNAPQTIPNQTATTLSQKDSFSFKYDEVFDSKNGLKRVYQGSKWGLVNQQSQIILPLVYDEVYFIYIPFKIHDNLASLRHRELIESIMGETRCFAKVRQGRKWGFINPSAKFILPLKYDEVGDFNTEGFAPVRQGEKWGLIHERGYEILPFIYDEVGNFTNGFVEVRQGRKWGLINQEGKVIIPLIYDEIKFNPISHSLRVRQGTQWISINEEGKIMKN